MANRLGLHFVTLIVGSADYFDSTWCTTEFVITMMNPRARTVVYDTAERLARPLASTIATCLLITCYLSSQRHPDND